MSSFNEKLQVMIKEYNLTQGEVAELAGCSLDTVKAWMSTPTSGRYREVFGITFYAIKAKILLAKAPNLLSKNHTVLSNFESALYHLENGLGYLNNLKGLDTKTFQQIIDEAKANLQKALADLNIGYYGVKELYPELDYTNSAN